MKINHIYHGNALPLLRQIPDNSIDCCITSPPYYGLRDYQTAPIVWGGEQNCKHDFEMEKATLLHENRQNLDGGTIGNDKFRKELHGFGNSKSGFCSKCKAWNGSLGLEPTPELFIEHLTEIFGEVRRTLKPTGTLWLNIGDSYASGKSRYSTKPNTLESKENGKAKYGKTMQGERPDFYYHPFIKDKDLIGIPWMLAFALRKAGWYLRMDIIWHKPNPMPESVQDRPTKSHEYIFLMSKSAKYYYNAEAIKTKMECSEHDKRSRQGRKRFPTELINGIRGNTPDKIYEWANKRSVWTVTTKPYSEAHFATFPQDLIVDCIKAGCPASGIVLDPFMGAGTTAIVARKLNRNYLGIELNQQYIKIAKSRMSKELGMFA